MPHNFNVSGVILMHNYTRTCSKTLSIALYSLGVGVEETVLSRVYVQNEIDIGGWNRDYKRRDTPKLYKAIDKVFEQVRV